MEQFRTRVRDFLPRGVSPLDFAILVVGETLYISGITPWVLVIGVASLGVRVFSRSMLDSGAIGATAITIFSIEALAPFISIGIPGGVNATNNAILLIAGVVGLLLNRDRGFNFRFAQLARIQWTPLGTLYGFVSVLFLFSVVTGSRFMAWASNNDAVWTLVQAREIFDDNGIGQQSLPNPAPLTATLIASSLAPGRNNLVASEVLAHDITLAGQFWIIVIGVTALIVGHLVSESMVRSRPTLRWFGVVGSGLLVFCWYFAGYATQFGFYNGSLAICVAVCAWAVWMSRPAPTATHLPVLAGATLAMLATWAPLAVIPAALACVELLGKRKAILSSPGAILGAVSTVAVVTWYVVSVSLPSLTESGSALTADGAMVKIEFVHFLVIALAVLGGIYALRSSPSSPHSGIVSGYAALLVAAFVGLGFLTFRRIGEDALWGYYPAKFAWLGSALFVVIGLQVLGYLVDRQRQPTRQVWVAAGGTTFVIGAMLLPGIPLASVAFAPLTNIINDERHGRNDVIAAVSMLESYGEKNMAIGFFDSPDRELELNHWLLQVNAARLDDSFAIRWYAYQVDGSDASIACEAIRAWGDSVVVHTSNAESIKELDRECGDLNYRVVVHGAAETP